MAVLLHLTRSAQQLSALGARYLGITKMVEAIESMACYELMSVRTHVKVSVGVKVPSKSTATTWDLFIYTTTLGRTLT